MFRFELVLCSLLVFGNVDPKSFGKTPGSVMCPVFALKKLLRIKGFTAGTPVVQFRSGSGLVPLQADDFIALRQVLRQAG